MGITLGDIARQRIPDSDVVTVDTVPTFDDYDAIIARAKEADIIDGYTLLARFSSTQFGLINCLIALGKPLVIIGMGGPGDMEFFPNIGTFIAANSPAPVSVEAAVDVLLGNAQPGGKLPMPIGSMYPIGYAGVRR